MTLHTHSHSDLQSIDLDSPDRKRDDAADDGDTSTPSASWSLRSVDWRAVAAAPAWPLFALALLTTVIPLIVLDATPSIHPRARPVVPGDSTFSYPYRPNSVPSWAAIVGPLIVWAATLALIEVGLRRCANGGATRALAGGFYHSIDLAGAILLTVLVTEATKLCVGYLRPYFFSACTPPPEGSPPGTPCTPTGVVKDLDAARVSFPSGHSSSSAAIAVFTALYALHACLTTPVRVAGWKRLSAASAADAIRSAGLVWALLTLLLPWCIGASRIVDYRHHPADVVAGWVLGGVIATLAFVRSAVGRAAVVPPLKGGGDAGGGVGAV